MKYYTNWFPRKYLWAIILAGVILLIVIFEVIINCITPPIIIENNPFIVGEGELPMLVAHRGGKNNYPENTLMAFKGSLRDYQADVMETDLWLTSDGYLVLNHDESINRTSDVEVVTGNDEEYLISEHTLEELQQFNYGYNFELDGEFPYRNLLDDVADEDRYQVLKENDLAIVTIDDLLSAFYDDYKEMLFIVEIKDSGESGYIAADYIEKTLTENFPDYKNRIVVGTFNTEVENYLKDEHPDVFRGASTGGVIKYLLMLWTGTSLFNYDNYACLQLPTVEYGINLKMPYYISEAHQRNIAVQYWTVNEEDEMRELIEKGVDAIMTDDPALLRTVLDSYK